MTPIDLLTIAELESQGWTISFNAVTLPGGMFYDEDFKRGNRPSNLTFSPSTFKPYFLREGLGTAGGTLGYDENIVYNDWENSLTNCSFMPIPNTALTKAVIRKGRQIDSPWPGIGLTATGITINNERFLKITIDAITVNQISYLTLHYSLDNGSTWTQVNAEGFEGVWEIPADANGIDVRKDFIFEVQRSNPQQNIIAISIGRGHSINGDGAIPNISRITGEFLDDPRVQFTAKKTFTDPTGEASKSVTYNYTNSIASSLDDAEMVARMYCSAIEWGMAVKYPAPTPPGPMLFPKEELYQWISPQQLAQFENMYPRCVEVSYNNALGTVYSQVGALLDIPAILSGVDIDDGTTKVFTWILQVLTAYNILAPAPQRSDAMESNYRMAVAKLIEIKNGASSSVNAPLKPEPNTMGVVVKRGCKMLG